MGGGLTGRIEISPRSRSLPVSRLDDGSVLGRV